MVMGQLTTDADVAVIGGGPGGYTAAIRAAQLGLNVILIEKNKLGGICTNVGCIPSKALIHAADVKHDAETAEKMGMTAKVDIDYKKTQEWKQKVVDELVNGIGALCKMNGVEVMQGRAFFTSSNTLSVQSGKGAITSIKFKKAIIATGTISRELKGVPVDHKYVIDSDDALSLSEVPKRFLIVGGGYIAVEMANMYAKLGSKVTVIYRGERLLKLLEPEISSLLLKGLKNLGVDVLFNSNVKSTDGNKATVTTPEGEKIMEFDKLLLAIGRVPYFEGLEIEKTNVKFTEKGLIEVDSTMKTTDESIFAIGDVVPGPQLAHKAFREGKVAAEVIAGKKSAFDNVAIPAVVFSDPEIANVGLSEKEAKEKGYKTIVGKMPFSASGRAKTVNRTEGFVKIIADENKVLLGAEVVGAGAGQLIAELALAVEMAATLEDVAVTIHAHPTLPESVGEAAEDALGEAIHLYRKKK